MDRFAGSVTEGEGNERERLSISKLYDNGILTRLYIDGLNLLCIPYKRHYKLRKWGWAWKRVARMYRQFYRVMFDRNHQAECETDDARAWARRMKRERDEARAENQLLRKLLVNATKDINDLAVKLHERPVDFSDQFEPMLDKAELEAKFDATLDEVKRLYEANARLREMVKSVEWSGETEKCSFDCGADQFYNTPHSPDCPAFDAQGNVK